MSDRDNITLPREVVVQAVRVLSKFYDTWPKERNEAVAALRTHLAAPSEDAEALRRDAEQGRWLRDWLDNNGLLVRAIRGESLAGYEHPDIEALRRDAEKWRRLLEGGSTAAAAMARLRSRATGDASKAPEDKT